VRVALFTLLAAVLPAAAFAAAPSPGAPPRVLNVTRVRLKPQSSTAYSTIEAQIVRAFERAKLPIYWIALQAPKDANDVLYLNLFDAREALDHATAAYRDAARVHPDLTQLQQRLSELVAAQTTSLTTRREDIDRTGREVDFATMHALRLTAFQVRPGREGEFVQAIRTANPKDGAWLVYEATDSSTFYLITLKRRAIGRGDAPPIPRTLRRYRGVYTKADTRVYAVRPAMSHVPQAFIATNPQLWRVPAGGTH
jgi:hypothetical protein